MMFSENNQISDETNFADTMNKHFAIITQKLKLKPTETNTNELTVPQIRDRYKDCKIIVKIHSQKNGEKNLFSFKRVTSEEVLKTIYTLKPAKDH